MNVFTWLNIQHEQVNKTPPLIETRDLSDANRHWRPEEVKRRLSPPVYRRGVRFDTLHSSFGQTYDEGSPLGVSEGTNRLGELLRLDTRGLSIKPLVFSNLQKAPAPLRDRQVQRYRD